MFYIRIKILNIIYQQNLPNSIPIESLLIRAEDSMSLMVNFNVNTKRHIYIINNINRLSLNHWGCKLSLYCLVQLPRKLLLALRGIILYISPYLPPLSCLYIPYIYGSLPYSGYNRVKRLYY